MLGNNVKRLIGIALTITTVVFVIPVWADTVPGRILVKIGAGDDIAEIDDDYGSTALARLSENAYTVETPAGTDDATFTKQLRSDPRVLYAEQDRYLELPEMWGEKFHFAFDAGPDPGAYFNQHAYSQVHYRFAPRRYKGQGVIVAVLDTGATPTHKALWKHLIPGFNAIQGGDPLDVPDTPTHQAVGHGTMVAGIVARLAPKAQIMPVRVLNSDGVGTMSSVLQGLYYAVSHGANVINMSFGSSGSEDDDASEALSDALEMAQEAGIVLVASAGNDDSKRVSYPAACEGVLAVAAVEWNDTKSPYSNYGRRVSVVAPGTGIRSAYWTGGYANWSGTSFAAPFVSAEAALLFSANPRVSSGKVRRTILDTAQGVDSVNPAYATLLGKGIIDFRVVP